MPLQPQSDWYKGDEKEGYLDVLRELFEKAVVIIHNNPALTDKERDIIQQANSLEDLQDIVHKTKQQYDQTPKSTLKHCLTKLSKRICYYGNIIDVLVQQHPEYVSLTWGLFKLLFVLVENHSKSVATLAEALTNIAQLLPQVQLSTILYPTPRMKRAVANLYACIMRFLFRAFDYYQKGRRGHIVKSFTHPAELQYADLIREIIEHRKEVERLATGAAQAEQRDMHLLVQKIKEEQERMMATIQDMYKDILEKQIITSNTAIDTNHRLRDIQLNSIMEYMSGFRKVDPLESLSYVSSLYKKHVSKPKTWANSTPGNHFWLHPKFFKWDSQKASSVIMVKGDYQAKHIVRSFAVNLIHQLQNKNIPVIWVLRTTAANDEVNGLSVNDILRDLICQGLRLNWSQNSEHDMAMSCAQFRSAESLDQWIELLAKVLGSLREIYLIVDIESIDQALATQLEGFSWISTFQRIFTSLDVRGCTTHLRVVILSYGSATIQESKLTEFSHLVVSARLTGHANRCSTRHVPR